MQMNYPNVEQSQRYYEQASDLIPGRTQLISRRADQFAAGVSPIYARQASGARFIDVDENEYLDWVNAVGAIILGHADPVVNDAVKEQIDRGSIFTLNSPLELELAHELNDTIPSSEMVRYTKGGGEACAVAARIARGTTGRDKMLICGYHGWLDWYQAANHGADPESGEYPFAGIEPTGVPQALADTVRPFSYGDLPMLQRLLDENRGQVAGIMMEPMRSELPPDGYLTAVRQLAHDHDVILIFDEVSCGWRMSIGGVQEYLGIKPDMTVVAKCMSNGYPMGAVVGQRSIMEPAARMFISSSYWSDNIGLVAALTTIRELKRRDAQTHFQTIGTQLKSALNQSFGEAALNGHCAGVYANPYLHFDLTEPYQNPMDARKVNTLFVQEMARRGIHCLTSFKATLAHTEDDIAQTAAAATEVFGIIKQGLEQNKLDELIIADLRKDPFRRLVK